MFKKDLALKKLEYGMMKGEKVCSHFFFCLTTCVLSVFTQNRRENIETQTLW